MFQNQRVSVVFPAYNEADNISVAVRDFLDTGVVDEVVVVDNNSVDNTAKLAESAGAVVVHEPKQGYGNALQRGLREAAGDLIVMAEPDGTFIGKDIHKLLAYADDFDMVCGTRTTKELIWDNANMGWFLRQGNLVVAKLLEFLFDGPSLSDCGCTMRLIKRNALNRFIGQLTVGGSHFLPEMVILALHHGIRIIEISVNYRSREGTPKITGTLKGTLTTGIDMILLILRYRFLGG